MPFAKRSGTNSQINTKLREKRKKIIEEERIRILGDSYMLFYEQLIKKYELIHLRDEDVKLEKIISVEKNEVEKIARAYASTKPIGY